LLKVSVVYFLDNCEQEAHLLHLKDNVKNQEQSIVTQENRKIKYQSVERLILLLEV
jgi:hypothetical protein